MSFASVPQEEGIVCAEGVLFWMSDIAKVVLVTRQTLHNAEDEPFFPFDELVRFRAHRARFEKIAYSKNARGAHQNDGSIRIINGDLND